MLTFLVRRIIGAILVMIAVTFIVFVIFIVVPGGDTAQRIAGKNATPQNIINIRHDWKFDKPFYEQYCVMLQKMFSGSLVSYTSQQNVVSADRAGDSGDVLADDRRRHHLALLRDSRGGDIRRSGGQVVGSPDHRPRAHRHLDAGVLARDRVPLLPGRGRLDDDLPRRRVRGHHAEPAAVVLPPDPAVARARRALHRLLRARAAREHPRHDQRGLRAHGAREGPVAAADPRHATCCARR